MKRNAVYSSLEKEYGLAGWVGSLQLMHEIGEQASYRATELLREANASHIGGQALNMCVLFYQKPHELRSAIDQWRQRQSADPNRKPPSFMLEELGITEGRSATISDTFADALDMHINDDVQKLIYEETDFIRLEPLIEEAVHFARPLTEAIVENKEIEAYKRIRREIDFHVGNYDPLRRRDGGVA